MGQVRLVPDFEVRKLLGRKGTRSMDRATGLAVTAAGQLLADDRVAGRDRVGENTGLVLGTSTGSAQSIMDFTRDSLVGARPFFVDPARFPNTVMNCAAGQCAIWHQLKGPNTTIAGGRVTGLHALQYALRLRKSGHADSVLCGAVEECSDARAWLERHSRGPEAAGTVLGEGCAMLLLGPAGGDSGDGADGLAEVLTLAFGVWHQESDIAPALAACVRRALKAAQAEPARVWAVSASGLPGALGAHEEAALADVFGTHRPERVRCSELIGETSAASAAFQVAAVLATAETHGDASGQIVLVTSFDHDGGIGCALMRLLLPRLNGRTKMTSVVPEVRTQHGQTILERIVAIPEGTWWSCQACQAVLHHSQVRRHQGVCPECGHHARLTAPERIGQLADPDSFTEYDAELAAVDQLGFVDQMPYPQRLAKARKVTALTEAAVTGTATFGGRQAVLVVLDFGFLGGSMGTVVGEKVTRAAKLALDRRVPLVTVSASGGARMQEGVLSLTQMAKTAAAIGRLREAGVPFLSVLTDPVYGGVAASFAALGDIILAESGTRAGFAGRQVIEQTSRQKLPDGFQTASFMYEHGHIDLVLDRAKLAEALRQLIAFCADAAHPTRPRAAAACGRAPRTGGDAWETVRLARAVGRPNALAYIDWLFSRFIPLSGDRWSGDDQAVIGGLAWLGETPLMLLAHCKGTNVAENVRRNFGMPHPAGYRKGMRLARLAERLSVPLVTLVDTPGAYPGQRSEEENQSGAIAEMLVLCASLRTPIVTVVTGEGGSGGALALATGDRLLMQENSIFSVISPEGCATILFGDASRAPEAARALRLDAATLVQLGIADEIVPEPSGGAHLAGDLAAEFIAEALRRHLTELLALDTEDLLSQRYDRLRSFGTAALTTHDSARYTVTPGEPEHTHD